MNRSLAPERRAAMLLAAMTTDEKFAQLVGSPGIVPEVPQCYGARHVPGIVRLHIPTFRITHGPVGVGQSDCVPTTQAGLPFSSLTGVHSPKATQLPSGMAVAASFDRAVATRFGDVIGTGGARPGHALRPLFPGREAFVAGAFGLVHGLAFATMIAGYGIDPLHTALTIFAFNLGIEVMQLVVVATVPWLLSLARTSAYGGLRVGGALVAGMAALGWIGERAFGATNRMAPLVEGAAERGPMLVVLLATCALFATRWDTLHGCYIRLGNQLRFNTRRRIDDSCGAAVPVRPGQRPHSPRS